MNDANQLLREYVTKGSESAFRELVTRYVDLVYSVALRRVRGDAHRAEEVTQTVFTDLARKAAQLPERVMLGGWLHRHTGFVASNLIRGEIRRKAREKEAATMMTLESDEASWQQVAPFLDDAIDQLEATDREAILRRFFERQDLRSLGAVYGVSEDAAQKRVSRAVDKLRELLSARGVALTGALLGTLLTERAVIAGPTGLAQSVGGKALQNLAPASLAAGLAGLLSWGLFKGLVALLVVSTAVAVAVWPKKRIPDGPAHGAVLESRQALTAVPSPPRASAPVPVTSGAVVETVAETVQTNFILLKLVAIETGQPVTGAKVKMRQWEGKKLTQTVFAANEVGEAEVLVARGTVTKLELRTERDGFADKRLLWSPTDGKTLPETYLVRLERAVTISGRVLDGEGKPVNGAKVMFANSPNPRMEEVLETHEFGSIETMTDAEGYWRINRIANGMISRISGRADHDLWTESPMQFMSQLPDMEEQLRQGTHLFRLGRPLVVRGVVVDPEGQPVTGARLLMGRFGEQTGETDVNGEFELKKCKQGKNSLNVYVNGFMPFTQDMEFVEGMETLHLVLQRGRTLRLRVTNPAGEPVTNARAYLSSYENRSTNTLKSQSMPDLDMVCDPDGRAFFSQAPDREMTLDIRAPGYMKRYGVKVRPDGVEHQIVLHPALVIEGTVKDADTGEPLPKFRILTGYARKEFGAEGYRPEWSVLDRFWLRFTGGAFRHSVEEPVVLAKTNPGYVFKFEAEGYSSHITGIVPADAGVVRFDLALRRPRSHGMMVKLPDGRPLVDSEVGVVSIETRFQINSRGFGNDPDYSAILRTDRSGIFNVVQDDTVRRVIVPHASGYGEETMATLLDNPTLQIRPWGRVEGIYVTDGKPMAGVDVVLDFKEGNKKGVSLDPMVFRATTDKQGKFFFKQVPFGQLTAHLSLPSVSMYGMQVRPHGQMYELEVRPGETTHLKLGGETYSFHGRVEWPRDVTGSEATGFPLFLLAPGVPLEAVFSLNPTPGRTLLTREGGAWSARDMAPGNYTLVVKAHAAMNREQPLQFTFFRGVAEVVLPERNAAASVDFGRIELKPIELKK